LKYCHCILVIWHRGLDEPAKQYGLYGSTVVGVYTAGKIVRHYRASRAILYGDKSAAALGMQCDTDEEVLINKILSQNGLQVYA
jgi:hypothetical protein